MIIIGRIAKNQVETHHKKVIGNMGKAFARAGYQSNQKLIGWLQADMRNKKSGRIYGKHQASSPSETPAVLSGRYSKSLNTFIRGGKRFGFGSKGNVSYFSYLETGTTAMLARKPILRTANANEKIVLSNVKKEIDKLFKK
jgi:hypothetical protein